MRNYPSEIDLDQQYQDRDTGFRGVAFAITFYRHDGARVGLKALVSNVPVEHWFDSAQLEHIKTGEMAGFRNGVAQ